jgi:hypothetical protein
MMLSGMIKPIFPAHHGMWFHDGHMIASGTQLHPPPSPAHEVLGMWYIPLMLTAGSLTLLATRFYDPAHPCACRDAGRRSYRIAHKPAGTELSIVPGSTSVCAALDACARAKTSRSRIVVYPEITS